MLAIEIYILKQRKAGQRWTAVHQSWQAMLEVLLHLGYTFSCRCIRLSLPSLQYGVSNMKYDQKVFVRRKY
jgi:hypothetical protein